MKQTLVYREFFTGKQETFGFTFDGSVALQGEALEHLNGTSFTANMKVDFGLCAGQGGRDHRRDA